MTAPPAASLPPVASLPMYARPETDAAQTRLWGLIHNELQLLWQGLPERAFLLPDSLSAPKDLMAHWQAPNLAFSQTCGLPYRTALWPHVTLVGTPDYRLPGCPPGYYNSVLVMRKGDKRRDPTLWPSLCLACNEAGSQSGWAAAQTFLQSLGAGFSKVVLTGSHRASAHAVASGQADIASIDAQTWRQLCRWDDISALEEVLRTDPTPGLPYITAGARNADDMHFAVSAAINSLDAQSRDALDLRGLVAFSKHHYQAIPTPSFPWNTPQERLF